MEILNQKQLEKAIDAASGLKKAFKPLKVLRSVEWPNECRREFLKDGKLPDPEYKFIDVQDSLDAVTHMRGQIKGDHPVFEWLNRLADVAERTAHMITARGRREFSTHSQSLYGMPSKHLLDKKTRVIDLARHMDQTLTELDTTKLVMNHDEERMNASEFRDRLSSQLGYYFQDQAPDIYLAGNMSAKAVAGSDYIKVHQEGVFTPRDVDQLIQHEALVHVATSMNGKAQTCFPLLGRSHAGITEIQEGLAVFAEMISGAMDPTRFHRLSDRVIAIQMSLDGADFKEVFDFYEERSSHKEEAYENTRRIFRGGLIEGGAPFTKDMVYLNGLLRVHNFMRTVVKLGRADLIRMLFIGKLDLEDIPALANLVAQNVLDEPKFMPPWAKDLRFLVSYLAYSSFLNQVKMPGFQAYYEEELAHVPIMWDKLG